MESIDATPWCQHILNRPDTAERQIESRTYPGRYGPNENAFFGKTMASASGIKAAVALVKNPDKPAMERELLCILSVGSDLDAHSGIMAGGAIATISDELLGMMGREMFPRSEQEVFYTVGLELSFKKPIMTPAVLLARARIVSSEGRKLRVEGSIEDGEGKLYSTCKCLFLSAKGSRDMKL